MKRRAPVTGAAICRALAEAGAEVIVHANRRLDEAKRIAAEIGSPHAIAFDVADRAAVRAALEPLVEDEPIHIVVNNAGVHDDAAFPAMRPEQWDRVIAVSLHGFYNVTQPLVMPMVRARWGRIVSVTSVAAEIGNRGQVNYAAAKGALHAASRSLARELGSRGVTVNCVSPGLVDTPMSAGLFAPAAIERMIPLRRMGRPEEIAAAVAFLAGESAGYITGQVVPVNGGMA